MNLDIYPDSYQNDVILDELADFWDMEFRVPRKDVDTHSKQLLKYLERSGLRIGWINRDKDGYLTT